jgi:hypothetical protein
MERCENCGSVLPTRSDPLCHSCMSELRAAPYPPSSHDRIEAAIARLAEHRTGTVGPRRERPDSAA